MKTLNKIFRVYAKLSDWTLKGGSGYDIIEARDEMFNEFDAWYGLIKPAKILDLDWGESTDVAFNVRPFCWLNVTYQVKIKERVENLEDILRRIKELNDWDILTCEHKKRFQEIFAEFLDDGKMSEVRLKFLTVAKKCKDEYMKKLEYMKKVEVIELLEESRK